MIRNVAPTNTVHNHPKVGIQLVSQLQSRPLSWVTWVANSCTLSMWRQIALELSVTLKQQNPWISSHPTWSLNRRRSVAAWFSKIVSLKLLSSFKTSSKAAEVWFIVLTRLQPSQLMDLEFQTTRPGNPTNEIDRFYLYNRAAIHASPCINWA